MYTINSSSSDLDTQTDLEVLNDGLNENKEDVRSVGDVDVCRGLAQLHAGGSGALCQLFRHPVVTRYRLFQLVNEHFLKGQGPICCHRDHIKVVHENICRCYVYIKKIKILIYAITNANDWYK